MNSVKWYKRKGSVSLNEFESARLFGSAKYEEEVIDGLLVYETLNKELDVRKKRLKIREQEILERELQIKLEAEKEKCEFMR